MQAFPYWALELSGLEHPWATCQKLWWDCRGDTTYLLRACCRENAAQLWPAHEGKGRACLTQCLRKVKTIWRVCFLCEHHGEDTAFPYQPALDMKYFLGWIVSLHASESPNLEILWWMLGKNPEKKSSKLVWWGKLCHL